jgi:hypothetical protein
MVYPFVTYGMIATQSGTAWPVAAASKPTTLSVPVMASAVGVVVLVGYFRRCASAATVRDLSRTSTGYRKSHSRTDGVLSGWLHQNGGIRKVQYYLYPDLPFRLSISFICFRD